MGIYSDMARSQSISDAFSAIAEPRRRELLGVLATTHNLDRDVSWLVQTLGWRQPQISKHLRVLREVGLVNVVQKGKRRMYSLNGRQLRPLYDWIKAYERFWEEQLQRIKSRAEQVNPNSKLKQDLPLPPQSEQE